MHEAEVHSGLRLSEDAPNLLPEAGASNNTNTVDRGRHTPNLDHGGAADLCVVKIEEEDSPLAADHQRLVDENAKLQREKRNLETQLIRLQAQTSCELSQVCLPII